MGSNLYGSSQYTATNGINRDPGCSPRPDNGWYTRTGQPRADPAAYVRSFRIIRNGNLIEPISPSNPNDGYTPQTPFTPGVTDELVIFYDGYIYKPGTYRGTTYGWDNTDESCSYQAPPGGDNNNAFDLVESNTHIIAYISVSPTEINIGDSVTLTYYTAESGSNPNGIAYSSLYWSRSTSSGSGTYSFNTYTFEPDVDQTLFTIEIVDGDGNKVKDTCAITINSPPEVTISTNALIPSWRNKPTLLLGNSHVLTVTGQAYGSRIIDNLLIQYPFPTNTNTINVNGNGTNYREKSYTLTPTVTTQYRVEATDNSGESSGGRILTVYVDDPPAPVPIFFVNNTQDDVTINIGESVTLSYFLIGNYRNSMYFTDGVTTTNYSANDLSTKTITLEPTITTTYTVGGTGQGSYGTTLTATPVSRTVTVISDPPQPYISASSTTIVNGGSTTLTYGATGTNISSMTLSYPGFSESYTDGDERTLSVSPTSTTTYTCSSANSAGNGQDATVTVTVLQPPTGSLTVDQSSSCPGVNRTFTYSATGDFSSASINDPNGTQIVSFTTPQTSTFTSSIPGDYTLTITAGYGNGTYDVIDSASFTELQTTTADLVGAGVTVYSGSNVTLSWYVQGSGVQVSFNQGIGVVNQNGFTTVTPTIDTTYTMTATGTCNTVTDTYVVTVLPAPPSPVNPTLVSDAESIIRGNPVRLDWQASSGGSSQTYSLTDYTGDPGSIGFNLFYPTDDKTYTYTVNKTYTSITYTNTNTLIGWVAPGVPCPSGQWKCGSNLPHPNGLLGDKCCQVVSTTNTTTETETASVSIIVYQPPELTLTVSPTNTMIVGEQRTLQWSVSGDADRLVWTSPSGGDQLTNTNLVSTETVNPTVTTTYTAYPTGLGGVGTAKSVTITVYQTPTLSVNWPEFVEYGNQTTIEYTSEYANTSVILASTYYFLDGTVVNGTPVELSNPNSAEFNVGVTEVTDEYTTEIPWSNRGAMTVVYTITATGSGGLASDNHTLVANVDITPVNINIQDSEDLLANQNPVVTPGSPQLTSQYLIDDIDVDVEIKADYPIQVQVNNDGTWENVREL